MPDENDKRPVPYPIAPRPPIDRTADDAIEPDPMSDEIDKLQREAQPKPTLCPHCGKEIPKE